MGNTQNVSQTGATWCTIITRWIFLSFCSLSTSRSDVTTARVLSLHGERANKEVQRGRSEEEVSEALTSDAGHP